MTTGPGRKERSGDAEVWQGPLPEEAGGCPGEPWQGHPWSSAGRPALWSRCACAPGPGHTPCPSEAAREVPGWTLGFCTQITFPDFRGTSGVCSRELAPVALNPMATLQTLGRSGQAQSWRRTVGCGQPARSVSRGRHGHGQPEQQQEGAVRVLARPDGPLAAWPDILGWAYSPCPAQWPPRCLVRPFLGDWLAPATLDGPLILRDLRPVSAGHLSHVSARVQLSLAAPRPRTPGVSDCTLPVTLPLTGAQ